MKYLAIVVYVAVMVSVGVYSMRRTRTLKEYFLGDRAVGPWMSAFAYGTTYFSAVLFVGYAGKVGWGFGLSALWVVVGNTLIGSYLAWRLLARPARRMTERLNALTMPEFLAARYDSQPLKVVSALIIFVFLVPYSASVYLGLSYLFEKVFLVPYTSALLLMAVLTGVYLVLGGYLAVALNDFIQGIIMVVGVLAMLFFIVRAEQVGGLLAGVRRLADLDPSLVAAVPPRGSQAVLLLSMVVLTSLGVWGLPQMVQKFYAIKDERSIRPATVISTLFALLMSFGAYFTGSLSHLFFDALPRGANGQGNPDLLMPMILTAALPEALVIVVLLLVLSASMSTLASLVLVSSSVVTVDLVKGALRPEISARASVALSRILVVVFIAVSVYLALEPRLILTLMSLSWGAVAGSFLAPFVWGLRSRRVTKAGAWAGLVTGLGTMVVLSLSFSSAYIPLYGSVAIVLPLLVVPAVSAMTEPFSERHLDACFGPVPASRPTADPVVEPA